MQGVLALIPDFSANRPGPVFLPCPLGSRQLFFQPVIVLGGQPCAIAGGGGGIQTEVNPQHLVAGGRRGQPHFDRDVQVPAAAGVFRERACTQLKVRQAVAIPQGE